MREIGFAGKFISISKACVTSSSACIKIERMISDHFDIVAGLRQGDAISPQLFNVALEKIIRALITVNHGIPLNGLHKVLGYAVDLDIIAYTKEGLDNMYE
ncbi:hypothetical protein PR048_016627 [Dryococelus australis]|uniref:Reverse transcriptase domain-containing protein n=1 Tax=Dryococelus australis TaxID=614101 RepID=A0ABQ9H7A9_9NEOP|nr:hypothetical protein PR048_016627 [Dryococelus australis]